MHDKRAGERPIHDELRQAAVAHYTRSARSDPDVTEVRPGLKPGVVILRVGAFDVPSEFVDDGEFIIIRLPLGGQKKVRREKFFQDVGFVEQLSG